MYGGPIDWKSFISPIALFSSYFLCIFFIFPSFAVWSFRKNKLTRDLDYEVSFFEDHIETVNKYGSAELGFDPAETGLPGGRPGVHPSGHEAA